MPEEVLALFSGKYKFLKSIPVEMVQDFEEKMLLFFKNEHPEIIAQIDQEGVLSDELIATIKDYMQQFLDDYK